MIGRLIRYRKGYVRLRFFRGSCDRFLSLCAWHGLYLWDLQPAEEGYEVSLSVDDFFRLKPLAAKSGVRVRLLKKRGLPFWLHTHRKRKAFALGVAMGFACIFFLSSFIWGIEINGNLTRTDGIILEFLESQQIRPGTGKGSIDCKELAARLRMEFSDFTWVSVKLKGTRLFIDVTENTDSGAAQAAGTEEEKSPRSLVSTVDGEVVSMITREGTPLVSVGDTVQKGDVLISGRLEIFNDSNELAAVHEVAADGEIQVKTSLDYQSSISMVKEVRVYTGRTKTRYLLQLSGAWFGLPSTDMGFAEYDGIIETSPSKFLENIGVSASLSKITYREYKTVKQKKTEEEATAEAEEELLQFLKNLREKGVHIFENNVKIGVYGNSCTASGSMIIVEEAGTPAPIEYGQESAPAQEGNTT